MLETLRKYGYNAEADEAGNRLLAVIEKDKKMRELFNSQTGEGLGSEEQGWTCAIFAALTKEREKNNEAHR